MEGMGLGRGRGLGLLGALGRGRGRTSMFANIQPPPPTTIDMVKHSHFQNSILKNQLESSWDKAITTRTKKEILTNKEFILAVKTAGEDSEDCKHLIIHTTCKCSDLRIFGVCTRCYLVFCNEPCLKEGLSTPDSRVGLASQDLLKDNFGIRKNNQSENKSHVKLASNKL